GTEFSVSGLQGTDTVESASLFSLGAAQSAGAGSYTISISDATGGTFDPSNYEITYVPGTLEVFVTDVISGLTPEQQNALASLLENDFDSYTRERLLKFLNSKEGRILFEGDPDKTLENILLWISSFDLAGL
ncbi:MAG: MBG domain-containing protein, partial [Verrucomicrobiota bacterium]